MNAHRGWRAYLPDAAIPAVIGVLLVLHVTLGAGAALDHTPVDYLLLAVGGLTLAASRRAPGLVVTVTALAMAAYILRVQAGPPAAFPVMVAVYLAARAGSLMAPVATAGFLAAYLFEDIATTDLAASRPGERTVLILGWFIAANVAGAVSRRHRAYLEQVEQRAAEAERTREETARRRAGEERLRIARELHDSLTHSISIIKLQANVAIHLARRRGEPVPEALLAIQEASGEAMRELRATLEVLRDPDGGEHGLGRIAELVDRARSAGLAATLTVEGVPRSLPAEVDRAAYRILQEALTNVGRHAGPAKATVLVEYLPEQVVVGVDDDGRASPDAAPVYGNGLTGMRERVAALGGSLRAEPRQEGGFTVRAELPT